MKKILLSTVAAMSVLSGAALAADLPMRRAPPPAFVAVPVFTWQGLYVGVNAGYAWGQADAVTRGTIGSAQRLINAGTVASGTGIEGDGFTGGGQIGYNWQFGSVVMGLETDIQYTGTRRTVDILSNGVYSSYRSSTDYLGTVRGRIGYAMDRWMIYATGGMAYGNVFTRHAIGPIGNPIPGVVGTRDDVQVGYTVGAGVEYAMPVFNLGNSAATVKVEYLYYNLGDRTMNSYAINGTPVFATKFQNDGHIVRAGLNWKFNAF